MADLILGIDIGTTAVKAGVIGTDGRMLAGFSETYPTQRPAPGIAEQDPADWLARLDAALLRLTAEGRSARLRAVGVTSQVNTHLFLDAAGRPLMPAITWQDTRAAAEAAELDATVSPEQRLAWWGAPMPIDASHALARMLWTARHRPALWAQTRHVVLPKDYALLHLTGELRTDPLSNIGLTDAAGGYIPGVLALVPGAADRMAPLAAPAEAAGRGRPGGPIAGLPVVTGTMDGWCALFGAGGAAEGAGVHVSGTSEVLGICAAAVHPTPGVIVFPSLGGLRLHAGPTQAGGAALAWFCGWAGLSAEAASEQVAARRRRALTPLFLPQLQGERAPLWDAALRGAFLGLDQASDRTDLARAVMEGVALSARHALAAVQGSAGVVPEVLTCGGGGFRSEVWMRIRTDVHGRPMRRLSVNEPGLLGAAALAAQGAGLASSLAAAHAALARFEPPVTPDPALRGLYDDLFGLYTGAISANARTHAALLALAARAATL